MSPHDDSDHGKRPVFTILDGGQETGEHLPLHERFARATEISARRREMRIVPSEAKAADAAETATESAAPTLDKLRAATEVVDKTYEGLLDQIRVRRQALDAELAAAKTLLRRQEGAEHAASVAPASERKGVRRVTWFVSAASFLVGGAVAAAFLGAWAHWTVIANICTAVVMGLAVCFAAFDLRHLSDIHAESPAWPENNQRREVLLQNAVAIHQAELTAFWARYNSLLVCNVILASMLGTRDLALAVGRILVWGGWVLCAGMLIVTCIGHLTLHTWISSAAGLQRLVAGEQSRTTTYERWRVPTTRVGWLVNLVSYLVPALFALGYGFLYQVHR